MHALTRHATMFFGLLSLSALAGFWTPYLSTITEVREPLLHVHVLSMACWCGLLVAQPLLIHRGRRDLHRALGRSAWGLAPAIVLVGLALAVARARPAPDAAIDPVRYSLFFLHVATLLIFATCVTMALMRRDDATLHARWMVASGLTFVDSICARVFAHLGPPWPWLQEQGSVVLSLATVGALVVAERRVAHGRHVFALLLAMLGSMQAAFLVVADWAPWRRLMQALLVA